jgi:hypothetical protein
MGSMASISSSVESKYYCIYISGQGCSLFQSFKGLCPVTFYTKSASLERKNGVIPINKKRGKSA